MPYREREQSAPSEATPIALVITATSIGFAVVQLDVSIVNVALAQLSIELNASISNLQWVVDAYSLTFAVLLLSAGAFGDWLGARRAYLIGLAIFAVASAICGAVQSVQQLIAARIMHGIGAAILVPPSLALLNHACANNTRLRARAVGIWTATAGVSVACGPIVGGLLLSTLGWRSIFFVNLPLCLLGVATTARLTEVPRDRRRYFDIGGQIFAVVALTCLIASVIKSGALGFFHPWVFGGLASAVLCTLIFVYIEGNAAYPMLPLSLFRRPNFSPTVLFGIAINFTYYGLIFIVSLYLQNVQGYTADRAGFAFLPLTATLIVANLFSGWMAGQYGDRRPMVLGALVCAAGFALLLQLDSQSSYFAMLLPFLAIPAGMGLAVPAMTNAMLSSVEKSWSGTASAVLNSARQAGGAIGVAVFGALIAGGNEHIVPGMHAAAVLSAAMLVVAAAIAWIGIVRTR
ncbi:MFS transporter [Bradyrhizobium sp. 31Argb]|uniref:MFS transporter n=1 Tax=unclassified Bradyrhizobium TaxID=2631580 RepID=UPI00249E81F3|nr:MFS transporter [Bradyrhizobium sp. Arg237L]MDI4234006.1 MFS transporter [Bradyrhizobium sp. Arg237L]